MNTRANTTQELHAAYPRLLRRRSIQCNTRPSRQRSAAIGAAPSFVRWIKFMVTGHRRVIRTAYSMGDPGLGSYALESGTPQGDPLSPLLWATVVDFALRHARDASGARGLQDRTNGPPVPAACAMPMTSHCSRTRTHDLTQHHPSDRHGPRGRGRPAQRGEELLRRVPCGTERDPADHSRRAG